MKKSNINIYSYTNFREFMKDRLEELKKLDSKHSYRYLSNRLGLKSKSHLKMIADGKHNMSDQLTEKISSLFNMNQAEKHFFFDLVEYGQSDNIESKQKALESLQSSQQFVKLHQLELEQLKYYADPLTLVLREIIDLPEFEEDYEFIKDRFPYPVTEAKIKKAINSLLKLGLVIRTEDGNLVQANHNIKSGDGMTSIALNTFYANSFKAATGALKLPRSVRRLGGITFTASPDAFRQISELFTEFIKKANYIAENDKDQKDVYQFVGALFPLTNPYMIDKENKNTKKSKKEKE